MSTPRQRAAGPVLSVPRPRHPRHHLRTHLLHRKKINISTVLAGQLLGIKNLAEEAVAEDARAEKRPQAKPRSPRKKTKDQNSSSSST